MQRANDSSLQEPRRRLLAKMLFYCRENAMHPSRVRSLVAPIILDRIARMQCVYAAPYYTCRGRAVQNGGTDRDAVWGETHSCGPKEPCIRWESRSPTGKGPFWGRGHVPIHCKLWDVRWRCQKAVNTSDTSVKYWRNGAIRHLGI